MKLILKQYLSSLRERGELDAILPDLLSQLGLNVYSRPGRGTLQRGVDVGAVGSLDGGPEKVYLFSIKAGDLTRRDWDGDSDQSLRPSLNEIIDAYIPNRLPVEHRGKNIVICICFGGDIQEQVREQLKGFIDRNTTTKITFEEWNGDKLADLIQSNFLREDLLPEHARSRLRKSLALLDEPKASYKHFFSLIKSLVGVDNRKDVERITVLRQMSICLWILFAWAREAGNMESAYLSSELALLHGWKLVSMCAEKKGKVTQGVGTAFLSIFSAYQQICSEFLATNVLPHAGKMHAISSAVRASCSLDINLKLFDLLGRLAMSGIWAYWGVQRCSDVEGEAKQQMLQEAWMYASSVKALISNNPTLLLPEKDDQAIDIFITVSLLALDANNHNDIKNWLAEILERASFAYRVHGRYPCILSSYSELLSHPKSGDKEYRENVTSGSILYPTIALWSALLDDEETYRKVALLKEKHLQHCNFQFWYPDEHSEEHLYTDSDSHGAVLSHVCVEKLKEKFLEQVFGECEQSPYFKDLSAAKYGWWPLIVVACRLYRLPVPLQLVAGFCRK
ncbi:hypothetical protein [Methylocaldum gracile]|jgi:hypothetical protein|nr:hypothetical protein [Methylocaldum sp. BRCS4]